MIIEITVGLIGSVVGAVASCLTIWGNIRRPVDNLKEKVSRLENERIAKIERKMELHCESDKSQTILATLEGLRGDVSKIGNKLDRIAEESSNQKARIDANEKYINNLDDSLQRHKSQGGHNHHGH